MIKKLESYKFVDDIDFIIDEPKKILRIWKNLKEVTRSFGMKLGVAKSKTAIFDKNEKIPKEFLETLKEEGLEVVHEYKYLGLKVVD